MKILALLIGFLIGHFIGSEAHAQQAMGKHSISLNNSSVQASFTLNRYFKYTSGVIWSENNTNYHAIQIYETDGDEFGISLGPSYTFDHSDRITGSFQIILNVDFHYTDRWSISYLHISNARVKRPNLGIDQITLKWRW